jgi:hypothetical protein
MANVIGGLKCLALRALPACLALQRACEHRRALQIATRYMYHAIMFTYVDANSVGHSANLIPLPWHAMQDAVDSRLTETRRISRASFGRIDHFSSPIFISLCGAHVSVIVNICVTADECVVHDYAFVSL